MNAKRQERPGRETERKCIATGRTGAPAEMFRFVCGPDDQLVPDLAGNLDGRGAWVCTDGAAINKAVSRNLFARAFQKPVKVSPTLVADMAAILRQQALQTLGLSRRAGVLTLGHESVITSLRSASERKNLVALILSSDASTETRAEMRAKHANYVPDIPFVTCFGRNELGLALGRANVVHAALAHNGVSRRFLEYVARLQAVTNSNAVENALPEGASDTNAEESSEGSE